MSEHAHGPGPMFDEDSWDERYRSSQRVWSGNPNPQLVTEVASRPPGKALDVGCGEGADAIWLASRGWTVVAADISGVALERAAQHARDSDPAAAARIEWCRVDLLARPPEPGGFDLVSAQFMQLPPQLRTPLFTALAAAVRDGGMLLVVGHHPADLTSGVPRPPMPELFYTPDEVAGLLDSSWTINVCEARPRPATTPDGADVTVHDTVVAATRLAAPHPHHERAVTNERRTGGPTSWPGPSAFLSARQRPRGSRSALFKAVEACDGRQAGGPLARTTVTKCCWPVPVV